MHALRLQTLRAFALTVVLSKLCFGSQIVHCWLSMAKRRRKRWLDSGRISSQPSLEVQRHLARGAPTAMVSMARVSRIFPPLLLFNGRVPGPLLLGASFIMTVAAMAFGIISYD